VNGAAAAAAEMECVERAPGAARLGFDPAPRARQARLSFISLRLFLTCWIVFSLHFATNAVREVYLALSIGDRRSFDVSEYKGLHPDLFEMPGRGTFINNNPGASLVGAIPYAVARPVINRVVEHVLAKRKATDAAAPEYDSPWPMAREFHRRTFERGLDVKLGLGAAATQALAMAPISALSVVTMFHILRAQTRSEKAALWLAVLYAFATPVLYRTAQLNHNLLVAHCALFAFALLWRPWDAPTAPERPRYFLAGFISGFAVVCDYSGVVVALVISIYGLARRYTLPPQARRPSDAAAYAAGMAVAAVILMGYQWACFGNPIYPAQFYMPKPEHDYAGMTLPDPLLLWKTAFDPRFGLFVSAPLLLLAFHVPAWLKKQPARLLPNLELSFTLLFVALFLLFCSMAAYGYLQFNSGVRFVVPVVPFVFLLASSTLLRMPLVPAIIIGVAATYWSWCLAMYREVELGRGVVESVIHISTEGLEFPWLMTAQRMAYVRHGTLAATLIALACAAVIWVVWNVRRPRPMFATASIPQTA
jgi:hypothetical protein